MSQWDSTTLDSFIVCDDCFIPVTENCQKALKRLQKHDSGSFLFVDAICINQNSINERNHQVAAMGDIYANAQKVICWTGDFRHAISRTRVKLNSAILCRFASWTPGAIHDGEHRYFWASNCKQRALNCLETLRDNFCLDFHFLSYLLLDLTRCTWAQRVWTG
jgi:hypothetical protein